MTESISHSGIAAPIRLDNIDTDQIIPSREMRRVAKTGLGDGLFAGWRYLDSNTGIRNLDPAFVLNRPGYDKATILLCGRNFGCGSSREHAVWALRDFGIRVILAESYGRIFKRNCAPNRILAATMSGDDIESLCALTADDPGEHRLTIDLAGKSVTGPDGNAYEFAVDDGDHRLLLSGMDFIDATLQYQQDIDEFLDSDRADRPWAYL